MASLELRSRRYRVVFRYGGQKYFCSLKTSDRREAEGCLVRLEENLRLLERGRIHPPPDADLATFLLSDGRATSKPKPAPRLLTLDELCRRYLEVHSNGALEANSLETVEMHLRHFRRTLGDDFPIARLSQSDLQHHIAERSKKHGPRGRRLSPVTLRKEMSSFRAVWNWAAHCSLLVVDFSNKGIVYPKTDEKPPFQTWEEIERQLARGVQRGQVERDLWDCLFLRIEQIQELLAYVRELPLQPFLYPMFCFAAHTGARRSEMMRCLVTDVALERATVLLREKKRARGQRTHRWVPLSPFVSAVLKEWLGRHPGGPELFCQSLHVRHSKTTRTAFRPVTRNEANDHFRRAVRGSKWDKLRGWHVFRHSFASNCAAKGVDQRLIGAHSLEPWPMVFLTRSCGRSV
jgi:integrase